MKRDGISSIPKKRMRALLIAEKPALRRDIEAVYKKHKDEIPYEMKCMEQRGHLLTLKLPDEIDETQKEWCWENLPFHPEDNGGWQYKVIEEKKQGNFLTAKERYIAIQNELKKNHYDFIIHAGDPDQEGELLINIVLAGLKNKLPVKRYWTNAKTEIKILDALQNLKDDDNDPMLKNLMSAAVCRQHSDYRFGMNISRAATLKLGFRVATGRVKTTMLGIVCKREEEIKNFIPKTTYGIQAVYEDGFTGHAYVYNEKSNENEEKEDPTEGMVWFNTKEEAEEEMDKLPSSLVVTKCKKERMETFAPKLFKIATAQIAAGKKGYSASKTLSIIQSLYDKKYVTYPRTGCEYLHSTENLEKMIESAASVPSLKPFIEKIAPDAYAKVRATKKWINDKVVDGEGHSALAPTTQKPDFDSLSQEEKDIYEMICRQFVAIFLPPLVQDKTILETEGGNYTFKSSGKTLISKGFSEIFNTKFTDVEIPEYEEGDELYVENYDVHEKTTVCPKRYTDTDLVGVCEAPHKFLEDKSLKSLGKRLVIGTPATMASIIKELIVKDKYLQVTKEGKKDVLIPTESGTVIYNSLKDCSICKVDMTGEWENKLEEIRKGKSAPEDFEKSIRQDVEDLIDEIKAMDIEPLDISPDRKVICKCPECGGDIISGAKGFSCSNWKEKGCKVGAYAFACESRITDKEFSTLLQGEEITKKIKKGSKSWEQKLKYDFTEHKIVFISSEKKDEPTGFICPKCDGKIIDKGKLLECKDKCGFKLWKITCGKTLTDAQINNLFKNGTTGVIKGLKGKTGNVFDASIILKDDYSTGFEFAKK